LERRVKRGHFAYHKKIALKTGERIAMNWKLSFWVI